MVGAQESEAGEAGFTEEFFGLVGVVCVYRAGLVVVRVAFLQEGGDCAGLPTHACFDDAIHVDGV